MSEIKKEETKKQIHKIAKDIVTLESEILEKTNQVIQLRKESRFLFVSLMTPDEVAIYKKNKSCQFNKKIKNVFQKLQINQ
jgi:hypothetical protein